MAWKKKTGRTVLSLSGCRHLALVGRGKGNKGGIGAFVDSRKGDTGINKRQKDEVSLTFCRVEW